MVKIGLGCILLFLAMVSFTQGSGIEAGAQSAFHQILGGTYLLMAAVFLTGGFILFGMVESSHKKEKQDPAPAQQE